MQTDLPWLFRPSSPAWNTSTLKFGVYVVLNKMYGSSADLRELMQRQWWALSGATNPQGQKHMANADEI